MDAAKIVELKAGMETAFINNEYNSNLAYQPQFLSKKCW